MQVLVKTFKELTTDELYRIMRLRSEVFVVEQECIYQDLDNKDQNAIHIIAKDKGEIVAYTRMFAPGEYFENTSIGRVVVDSEHRKHGYGRKIMKASLGVAKENFPKSNIEISAQTYLTKFYTEMGFQIMGEEYLEDGIPHVRMIMENY